MIEKRKGHAVIGAIAGAVIGGIVGHKGKREVTAEVEAPPLPSAIALNASASAITVSEETHGECILFIPLYSK